MGDLNGYVIQHFHMIDVGIGNDLQLLTANLDAASRNQDVLFE